MSNFKVDLDEIKSKIILSSEIEKKTKLTKKGNDYWCCCIFHTEKTPSMKINDELGKDNLCINANNTFTIALDTEIDDKLKMEGIVRDLIRHVQNFRKDSELEVNDRIIFSIQSSDEIINSINKFESYFKNETLISSINNNLEEMNFRTNFSIGNHNVEIGISKLD